MRTTLNIDDDILHAIKERARREHRSTGEVLSNIVRESLVRGSQSGEIAEEGSFYGFDPLPHRGPVVSNELIDRLRDEEP
ncbi:MAG: ribbon-helix-helix protein, CopG family [Thermoanaerobaculia bacterium]|nr:ribbon-helix-helix protein, CopG family [Thermoanaerobaculia bacterium]